MLRKRYHSSDNVSELWLTHACEFQSCIPVDCAPLPTTQRTKQELDTWRPHRYLSSSLCAYIIWGSWLILKIWCFKADDWYPDRSIVTDSPDSPSISDNSASLSRRAYSWISAILHICKKAYVHQLTRRIVVHIRKELYYTGSWDKMFMSLSLCQPQLDPWLPFQSPSEQLALRWRIPGHRKPPASMKIEGSPSPLSQQELPASNSTSNINHAFHWHTFIFLTLYLEHYSHANKSRFGCNLSILFSAHSKEKLKCGHSVTILSSTCRPSQNICLLPAQATLIHARVFYVAVNIGSANIKGQVIDLSHGSSYCWSELELLTSTFGKITKIIRLGRYPYGIPYLDIYLLRM